MITGNGRNRKLGNIFPRLGNKLHKSSYKSTCNHNCSNSHCIKITCEITTFQLNFSLPLKMWLRFQLQFNFDTYFLAAFFRVAFPLDLRPRPLATHPVENAFRTNRCHGTYFSRACSMFFRYPATKTVAGWDWNVIKNCEFCEIQTAKCDLRVFLVRCPIFFFTNASGKLVCGFLWPPDKVQVKMSIEGQVS